MVLEVPSPPTIESTLSPDFRAKHIWVHPHTNRLCDRPFSPLNVSNPAAFGTAVDRGAVSSADVSRYRSIGMPIVMEAHGQQDMPYTKLSVRLCFAF
jgi:hypothetical protein